MLLYISLHAQPPVDATCIVCAVLHAEEILKTESMKSLPSSDLRI